MAKIFVTKAKALALSAVLLFGFAGLLVALRRVNTWVPAAVVFKDATFDSSDGFWDHAPTPLTPSQQQRLEKARQHLPADFAFRPTFEEQPLRETAILSFLSASHSLTSSDLIFSTLNALLHAFQHHTTTNNTPNSPEFVLLLVTDNIPAPHQNTLAHFGTRLVRVPHLSELDAYVDAALPFGEYILQRDSAAISSHTVLQAFRLIHMYDAIVYRDLNARFGRRVETDLLETLKTHSKADPDGGAARGDYTVVSCSSSGSNTSSVSLLEDGFAFRPSVHHYLQLKQWIMARDGVVNGEMGLSGLMKAYFDHIHAFRTVESNEVGDPPEIPSIDYWNTEAIDAALFSRFFQLCGDVRKYQMQMLEQGNRDMKLMMPVVPASIELWKRVKESGVMMDTIAIVSMNAKDRDARDRVAAKWNQAHHFVVPNLRGVAGVRKIVELLQRYDWVWVVADHVDMVEREEPIHVLLGEWTRGGSRQVVVVAPNCEEASGSLVLGKGALKEMIKAVSGSKAGSVDGKSLLNALRNMYSHTTIECMASPIFE
ncbi:hypothetical protein HDU98_000254 [Podochytrium sp. JEL0797]|nr:hypothetical protein HDU98_000254 [Podochytrium sp. JEL0797]